MFQGHCQLVERSNIEDGEIHAIQEGLRTLIHHKTEHKVIWLSVDNQNALQALVRGPRVGREYVTAYLEDVKIMQHTGREIKVN